MKLKHFCKSLLGAVAVVGLVSSCNMEDHKRDRQEKTIERHEHTEIQKTNQPKENSTTIKRTTTQETR